MARLKKLHERSQEELSGLLSEKQAELQKLRFAVAGARGGKVQHGLRKDIARILTAQRAGESRA
jgi:ribosomal protein L29